MEEVIWVVMNYCDVGPTTQVYNGPSLENAISACVAMGTPKAHFCRVESGEVKVFSLRQARELLKSERVQPDMCWCDNYPLSEDPTHRGNLGERLCEECYEDFVNCEGMW